MNKQTIILSYLLLAVLTAQQVVLAQAGTGSNRDWATVMVVHPGEKLAVKLKNGQNVEATLSSVSETGLALLASGDKMIDIKREEARQIYRVAGVSAKKPALIGAVIGGAAGAGLGAAADDCKYAPCYRAVTIPMGAVWGAGIGAVVGLLVGKSRHKRTLVYEA